MVTVEKPLPSPICHPLVRGMILGDLSCVISLLQASWLCAEVIDLVGDRCSQSQPASLLRGALRGIVELCLKFSLQVRAQLVGILVPDQGL